MTKWADFIVSKVRYKDSKGYQLVDCLLVHKDEGETFSRGYVYERDEVIEDIKRGRIFCTMLIDGDNFEKGSRIGVIEVNGEEYLKTVINNKPEDCLGNLNEL